MIVAYHSSDFYAPTLGTSIVSLFENNKEISEIIVYVIEKEISKINKEKLQEIAFNYRRKIKFIPMPDINAQENLNLKVVKKKWIFDSYVRLFLHDILPIEVSRILYLDSDVIVNGSLKQLWNLDLGNNCIAAVADCLSEEYYRIFDLNETATYCNSGVILFDLVKWRRRNKGDEIRQYIADNNGYVFFMEQTVMNVVAQNEIYILPMEYNLQTLSNFLTYEQLYKLRKMERFYKKGEVKNAKKNPLLIHYTSCFLVKNRPWIEKCNHSLRNYYAMTPWRNEPKLNDIRNFKRKFIDIILNILPLNMTLSIASFLYNKVRIKQISKARG